MGIKIGNIDITENLMPSFIPGASWKKHLYQAIQERYNAKLQPTGQPVQTAPVGNMESQPNQWQGNGK